MKMMLAFLLAIGTLLAIPAETLAQPDTGAVRVLVTDEAKAVIPGARILLDGPLQRESVTDRDGVTVIVSLPAGTYQLRALLPGWYEARVTINVQASSTTAQRLTMRPGTVRVPGYSKPVRETMVTGCNFVDLPETLSGFVARADGIAQIRVREQRVESRVLPQITRPEVNTRNTVEVLAVFKRHALWPRQGRAEILQLGGDVDHGDYIERVRYLCHRPLIVGREYVLFLERSKWLGGWAILFGEHGAFLTDGPQLTPLGDGEFARSWRFRPPADLFGALKILQR